MLIVDQVHDCIASPTDLLAKYVTISDLRAYREVELLIGAHEVSSAPGLVSIAPVIGGLAGFPGYWIRYQRKKDLYHSIGISLPCQPFSGIAKVSVHRRRRDAHCLRDFLGVHI